MDTLHGQIHYRADGSGDPILFLHRTPLSSDEYALVIPILAKQYRVIALDILGYGDSDKPPRPYQLSEYAQSVVDFMGGLGLEKVNLVGEHTGAAIAAEVAASHPDLVDNLILSGFPLFTDEELRMRRKDQVPEHLSKFEPLQIKFDGSHMTEIWNISKRVLAGEPPEILHSLVMAVLKSGPRNIESHLALWQYEPKNRLPLIQCPTLVLMSRDDQFYAQGETIKNLIPKGRIAVIKGGGSFFPIQAPELYAETLKAFLKKP